MEVLYFLRERLTSIRNFYETSSGPFREVIAAIEDNRPPFDDPPYSEDGEPPYFAEWMEAYSALEVLGRTCVSMLSASLQLYFKSRESELCVKWEKGERAKAFKEGMIQGHRTCFETVLGVPCGFR
ncbi:hypothetical protein [Agrobacterium salinitolerans]|uniref:hypothetical protein n=1 Tax=Agrobacterium salinitolerans TaxID=1183413 RepID=UPI0022B84EEF|nr:hypothetical protein [Agrobacterium salinitolerans]MCZ7889729.1 hypothetical protein [Agrobacterium salinitolerans]